MRRFLPAVAVLVGGLTIATPTAAQSIIRPVAATINSGGSGFGDIADTYNGAGLSTNFVSGVTDFDAYIGAGPTHSYLFADREWFSNLGTTSASVTYDLGGVFGIDRLALWNDEISGIGLLNLLGSIDGSTFAAFATGLTPTDNPEATDYGADVFAFATQSVRYVRFDMSRCPQPDPGSFDSCAIGEVAFRAAAISSVPEPSTYLLMGTGLLALGGVAANRRKRPVA